MEAGERYHLIFLDIEFGRGEMDGMEAGRIVRKACRDNAASIVFISWQERRMREFFEVRPMDFLTKPLTRRDIAHEGNVFSVAVMLYADGGEGAP